MIHSIRWLGPLVLATAALASGDAEAQSPPAASSAESHAPADSAAAAADTPAANGAAAEAHADDFDRSPKDCITPSNIRETVAVDDSTILFYMRGGGKVTYRSALSHACPNLGRENRFAYKVTINRLCNSDLITVLEQYGAGLHEGFTCRLGSFYPLPYEEAEVLRKEHDTPNSTRGRIKSKPAELPPKSETPGAASSDPTAPSEPPAANGPSTPSDSAPR